MIQKSFVWINFIIEDYCSVFDLWIQITPWVMTREFLRMKLVCVVILKQKQ